MTDEEKKAVLAEGWAAIERAERVVAGGPNNQDTDPHDVGLSAADGVIDFESRSERHIREINERDALAARERRKRMLSDTEARRLEQRLNRLVECERALIFEAVAECTAELRGDVDRLIDELAKLRGEMTTLRDFAHATDSTPLPNPLSLRKSPPPKQ